LKKESQAENVLCVETTYPLFVKGAAAKVPARKRKIKIDAVFVDKAQPI
jgi:hypothetical protein